MNSKELIIILLPATPFLFYSIIGLILHFRSQKKHLLQIENRLHLKNGDIYTVVTHNGTLSNMRYSRIAYGKHSKKSDINLYFVKESPFYDVDNPEEIEIEYYQISSIAPKNQSIQFNNEPGTQVKSPNAFLYWSALHKKRLIIPKENTLQKFHIPHKDRVYIFPETCLSNPQPKLLKTETKFTFYEMDAVANKFIDVEMYNTAKRQLKQQSTTTNAKDYNKCYERINRKEHQSTKLQKDTNQFYCIFHIHCMYYLEYSHGSF